LSNYFAQPSPVYTGTWKSLARLTQHTAWWMLLSSHEIRELI
jgi:hypothetical protein